MSHLSSSFIQIWANIPPLNLAGGFLFYGSLDANQVYNMQGFLQSLYICDLGQITQSP